MHFEPRGPDDLAEYLRVPMALTVCSRLVLHGLQIVGEEPVEPWTKDYDAYESDRADRLHLQFDTTHWWVKVAIESGEIVGGAVMAMRTPGFDLLEGRDDLAHLIDLRVHPDYQRRGVGRNLWRLAEQAASAAEMTELRVETQDVNVPACRFYEKMGAQLISARTGWYGPDLDEVQLIWSKPLTER